MSDEELTEGIKFEGVDDVIEDLHRMASSAEAAFARMHAAADAASSRMGALSNLITGLAGGAIGGAIAAYKLLSSHLDSITERAKSLGDDWDDASGKVSGGARGQASSIQTLREAYIHAADAVMHYKEASQNADEEGERSAERTRSNALSVRSAQLALRSAQERLTGIKDPGLELEQKQLAVAKAREALDAANIRAAQEMTKAHLEEEKAIESKRQAYLRMQETAEKVAKAQLSDVNSVINALDLLGKKGAQGLNLGAVSTQTLAAAFNKMAKEAHIDTDDVAGHLAIIADVFKRNTKEIISDSSAQAIAMAAVKDSVLGSFGPGLAKWLAQGKGELKDFIDSAKQAGIPLRMAAVDTDEYNMALGKLMVHVEAAKESFLAFGRAGKEGTSWTERLVPILEAIDDSMTDTNGVLHTLILSIQSAFRIVYDLGAAVNVLVNALSQMTGIDPGKIWLAMALAAALMATHVKSIAGEIAHVISMSEAWALILGVVVVALGNIVAGYRLIHGASLKEANDNPLENIGKDIISSATGGQSAKLAWLKPTEAGEKENTPNSHEQQEKQTPTTPELKTPAFTDLHEAGTSLHESGGVLQAAADKMLEAAQLQIAAIVKAQVTAPVAGHLAEGGPIKGPGGSADDRAGLFALSNGEFVIRTAAVQHYGTSLFEALNNLAVGGFATGGAVSTVARAVLPGSSAKSSSILNLTIDGQKFHGLTAPADVASKLKSYAVTRQSSAAGRNPSWMR